MVISDAERRQLITEVDEQVAIAKKALKRVAELADGKDGNVIFLALSKSKDLDIISKCVRINKEMKDV